MQHIFNAWHVFIGGFIQFKLLTVWDTYSFIGNPQAKINSGKLEISVQLLYLQGVSALFHGRWEKMKTKTCQIYVVPVLNILIKNIFS